MITYEKRKPFAEMYNGKGSYTSMVRNAGLNGWDAGNKDMCNTMLRPCLRPVPRLDNPANVGIMKQGRAWRLMGNRRAAV